MRTVTDAALAGALYVFALLIPMANQDLGTWTPGAAVLAAAAFTPLVLRHRWPVPVLAATVAGTLLAQGLHYSVSGLFFLAVIAGLYTVGASTRRSVALTAGGAVVALIVGWVTAWSGGSWTDAAVSRLAWSMTATAVGVAVRNRRAYVAAVEERARRAEETREQEARRRVVEERLRIARELHDVVAHHIAVINVQAGVAAHLLSSSPEAAGQALAHVRGAGRTVLDELGMLLSVLRRPDEDPGAPTEPTPDLTRAKALVESFAAAGLEVAWTSSGQVRPVPPAVDLTAYRLIQESLTNAHKHGGPNVRLQLQFTGTELVIEVCNDPSEVSRSVPAVDGTGHGLLGMRERVLAIGGSLRAGRMADGGFRVQARLPVPPEGS